MTAPPEYVIVIPARYESRRLPGKPLIDIAGKPMLQHVWEAARASAAVQVVIATDDERICAAVKRFGGVAVMTASDHASGSDRIAECARGAQWSPEQLIVNLQGDEPEMPAACLDQVATLLASDGGADAATLYWPTATAEEVRDPNVVKVAISTSGEALCFSRSVLPYPRECANVEEALAKGIEWKRHLGLYCYRNASLQRFTALAPSPLEEAESLEQMRILENGGRILVERACQPIPPGIDTEQDLERLRSGF